MEDIPPESDETVRIQVLFKKFIQEGNMPTHSTIAARKAGDPLLYKVDDKNIYLWLKDHMMEIG